MTLRLILLLKNLDARVVVTTPNASTSLESKFWGDYWKISNFVSTLPISLVEFHADLLVDFVDFNIHLLEPLNLSI